jgi:hypothetical protein
MWARSVNGAVAEDAGLRAGEIEIRDGGHVFECFFSLVRQLAAGEIESIEKTLFDLGARICEVLQIVGPVRLGPLGFGVGRQVEIAGLGLRPQLTLSGEY